MYDFSIFKIHIYRIISHWHYLYSLWKHTITSAFHLILGHNKSPENGVIPGFFAVFVWSIISWRTAALFLLPLSRTSIV